MKFGAVAYRTPWGNKVSFPPRQINPPQYRNLSLLPADQKAIAWSWIKQHRPALALMLQTDATLAALITTFNASILLEVPRTEGESHGSE